MTSKSNPENISPFAPPFALSLSKGAVHGWTSSPRTARRGGAAGEAGHAHPACQRAHRQYDDEVGEQVQHGRRGERLEHAEAEFLHGARPPGELEQADGERDRGVL